MRAEDHTNTEADRSPHLLRHGDRVGVGRTMTGFVRGRSGKIRAMNEHKVGATRSCKILRSGQATSVATQVKVVVGDGPLVRGHPQASLTKA